MSEDNADYEYDNDVDIESFSDAVDRIQKLTQPDVSEETLYVIGVSYGKMRDIIDAAEQLEKLGEHGYAENILEKLSDEIEKLKSTKEELKL